MSNAPKNGRRRLKPSKGMSRSELEAAAAIFDEEFAAEKFRQPNASERKQWQNAKQKMGRPKIGQGVRVISISIEKSLLKETDRLAKRLRVSRARIVAVGLQRLLRNQPPRDRLAIGD